MSIKEKCELAWTIIKPKAILECLGIFLALLISVMSLAQPYILKEIIDFIVIGKVSNARKMIIVMIIIFIISRIISITNTYLFTYISEEVLFSCRIKVHEKAIERGRSSKETSGSVHSKILKELPLVVNLLTDTFVSIIINSFMLMGTFILVHILDSQVAIYLAIALPVVLVVIIAFNPLLKSVNSLLLDEYARINSVLMENLANKKGIQYTNTYPYAQNRFSVKLRKYIALKFRRLFLSVLSKNLLELIYFIPTVLLLFYGATAVQNNTMTIGTLIAISTYFGRFFSPLKVLTTMNFNLQQSLVSFERYFKYISENTAANGYIECNKLEQVCLKNVNFSYGNKVIFNNFNCNFKKGEITLITGENGVGKSTLIDLISGIIRPDKGEVVYDEIELSQIKEEDVSNVVGIVSQRPYLYMDTIENNIILGRKISVEDIFDLGDKLEFNDILKSKELNTSSLLTELGGNLSGGQMRKLSILQGTIWDSEILIYDEPLANLDERAKEKVIDYIKSKKDKKITIVISHENRNDFADNVLVLGLAN